MKTLLFSIMGLIVIASCTQKSNDTEKMKQEISNTDLAMSELAVKEGFYKALTQYADADFVKFSDGSFPLIGKKAFEEFHKDKPGPKTLTWEPVQAHVAESGDLGYTWGNWKFVLNDTTTAYGNYFTVWKKQEDGQWKMALDGGNSTPEPNK